MSLYGIKDSSDVTIISNKTKKPILFADYCNKTDIAFSSDTVYAKKKGVNAIGWDGNRTGTLSMEMQVFDLQWIALLMGSELKVGVVELDKREILEVEDASVTLSETPKSNSLSVFKLAEDGITHLDEQILGTPATEENTYSIVGKVITLSAGVFADGSKVVCYYLLDSASTAKSFTVSADNFPTSYSMRGVTQIRTGEGVDEIVEFSMNNIKPKSNMTLSLNSEDVTTLAIEWDILVDNDNDMFTFKVL